MLPSFVSYSFLLSLSQVADGRLKLSQSLVEWNSPKPAPRSASIVAADGADFIDGNHLSPSFWFYISLSFCFCFVLCSLVTHVFI